MKRALIALSALLALALPAHAQSNRTTLNYSATIVTGTTFQQIRPAENRWSITIQNNNANTDNCWVHLGGGTPTTANSILLTPGLPYQRYYPYVPSDAIQATCANTSDTLYVDIQ